MLIDKYFTRKQEELQSAVYTDDLCVASTSGSQELIDVIKNEQDDNDEYDQCLTSDGPTSKDNTEPEHVITASTESIDVADAATWPNVYSQNIIDHIITTGPSQIQLDDFPKGKNGRHFSLSHYSKKLSNNELIKRRWLIYSVSTNRVFCFCCRLFDRKSNSNLVLNGYNT